MKFYDVTQEVFSSCVYPGDPSPECERIQDLGKGDDCNLTYLKMCTHNGTHMDAPCHFIKEGRDIGEIAPEQFMGSCHVLAFEGVLDGQTARRFMSKHGKKLLFKGNTEITEEAASVFADARLELLGVEGQTVGTMQSTQKVHKILLAADMVIVEGLVLNGVESGEYFLCAMPLKLAGSDGAPCRVVLISEEL